MASGSAPDGGGAPRVYTVAELTDALLRVVRERTKTVWVTGEITNLRPRSSARVLYFTLRDAGGEVQVDATLLLWQTAPGFEMEDGMRVRVRAKPEFFPRHGALRLHVYDIEPDGEGTLLAQVAALRRRLGAEGLFSDAGKRALPFLPRRVGVIAARDGAARHDLQRTLLARCPSIDIVLVTALMQGPGCPQDVARALAHLDDDPGVEVIVIARGGGSVEDLMCFNSESIARRIAACRTPVVSAIGHEPDTTIACLVADVRADTPTAAGSLVAPDAVALRAALADAGARAREALSRRSARAEADLAGAAARPCLARPATITERAAERHDDLGRRLRQALRAVGEAGRARLDTGAALLPRALRAVITRAQDRLEAGRERLHRAGQAVADGGQRRLDLSAARLAGCDPTRPLRQGFALVSAPGGEIVSAAAVARAAQRLRLRFADGEVLTRVEQSEEARR